MPKSGKKLLVGILFLQLTEQQKSIHNAGPNSHHMKSIKTSALPKMKRLIFHLETSRVPYVITSPGQISAITSFLQKNSHGCFNFLFPKVVKYPPLLLSLSQHAAQASGTHGLQDYISSHFQTAPLPPHFLRLVCLQIVKPE